MARARSWGVALAVALLGPVGCGGEPGALVGSRTDGWVEVGISVGVGEVALVGGPGLVNDSDGNVVIEDAEVVGRSEGMEVVGWVLQDLDHGGIGAILGDFPPAAARPVGDRRVAPTRTTNDDGELISEVQVVFGLRPTAPGPHRSSSVRVTYTDGSGRHTLDVDIAYEICGVPADGLSPCS